MALSKRILSIQGDLAVRRLGALTGFHQQVATLLEAAPSAVQASDAAMRTLREAVLVRCMSILEAYVTDVGRDVVSQHVHRIPDDRSRVLGQYLSATRWKGARSWPDYEEIWKDGLGLSLGQFDGWAQIVMTRAARNAIVHSVGEYDAEYRRVARSKLVALGIDPDRASGRIPLDESDVRNGLVTSREFVFWTDPQTS